MHEGATGFNLERKAFNEADFAADVQGYSADHEPINAKQGVEFHYTSNLPLEALALAASAAGYPCEVSNDAGRYLCNYVYFSSLMKCARKDEDALFCARAARPMYRHGETARVRQVSHQGACPAGMGEGVNRGKFLGKPACGRDMYVSVSQLKQ